MQLQIAAFLANRNKAILLYSKWLLTCF